jgi:carbon-monoxide dehydrogenase large subunit/6-hydroxypseudooxynicotine dehydrogenase subunit gamma
LVGAGLAVFVDKGGLGPADGTRVSVDTTGAVELVTGGSNVGQGFATAMAQICADTLGVDYRRVRVVYGQTDRIAYGIGAHASRASVMTGGATHAATLKLRAKALEMAAALLQTAPDELDIVDGVVGHRDRPGGPSITLGEIAPPGPRLSDPRRSQSRARCRRLVSYVAHDLSLRRPDCCRAGRCRHRRGDGRALSRRLRYRARD